MRRHNRCLVFTVPPNAARDCGTRRWRKRKRGRPRRVQRRGVVAAVHVVEFAPLAVIPHHALDPKERRAPPSGLTYLATLAEKYD